MVIDNGAYVSWGSTTPYVMLSTVAGLYRCPAVRFDTTIAYTNNPYSGSMRGYGNLESTFAVESQMDELADQLGLDRLELRRRNVTRPGDANPQGFVITSCAMGECLDAVTEEMRREVPPPPPGWKRGVGYAGMFHVGGGARIYRSDGCGAIIKCDDFGRVSLITGATEIGQGSETVLAMIVAETLGVPLERVEVLNSDTSVKPWDVGAHASRTTFIAGNAARLAAEKLRDQLLAMAAPELEAPVEQLRVSGGWIYVGDEPQRRIAYDRAARAGHLRMHGQTLVAEAFYDPPTTMLDKDLRGNVSATYGFAAQAVVLDVELATGVVRVRRIISAHDVGRALNPLAAEGQIHGGVHMGLGYALSERLVVQEGQVLTAIVHGLRAPQGRRHAGDRRTPDRDRGFRGTVRRQGPGRVGRHPGLGGGGQRGEGRDRCPVQGAADYRPRRVRGAGRAERAVVKLFEGVRVLDLSRMLAGPYGSMLLADMGAEVIKIEEPDGGDPMRVMGPPFLPDGDSAYFLAINRNKKSVALDLTKPAGRSVFLDLAAKADIVWENFRPGIMERLGLHYAALTAANPGIVMCSISAYGQDGPYRDWPAFDLALQAMGGAMSLTGEEGSRPVRMGLPMGDLAGGMFGAFAVAGALYRRSRTGGGAHIDLSLLDCQVSLLTYIAQYFYADGRVPRQLGSGHASVVPYGALASNDGHLVVAIFAEKFWGGFCRAVEHPEWEHDPRFASNRDRVANRGTLMALIETVFKEHGTEEWLTRLNAAGVPVAPIQAVDRVLADPQVRHRRMVAEVEHPGHGPLPTLGTPIKIDGQLGLDITPPARLGQHTDAVLGELLGYPAERLATLRRDGVVA